MPVKGSHLVLIGAGAVIAYSGFKGKGIGSAFRATISGKSPASASSANLINPAGGSYLNYLGGKISIGGYVNPFSRSHSLTPNRVDQGVDFGGTGPIVAIGSGRIIMTINSGWPGGAFISIRLSDGAYAGKYVYFAENIRPTVSVGQKVNAGDVIGIMQGGIECGWAFPPGLGPSMARMMGQWDGTHSTAYGSSFNNWLQTLGVPSGVINAPIKGSVLPSYPPSGQFATNPGKPA